MFFLGKIFTNSEKHDLTWFSAFTGIYKTLYNRLKRGKGKNMKTKNEFFDEQTERNLGKKFLTAVEKNEEKIIQKTPQVSQIALLKQIYFSGFLTTCNLTGTTKLVLFAFAEHYNSEKEEMFPSQRYLAERLGISEKSVERSVKELASQGFVSYTTQKVNRYKFTKKFFDAVKMSGNGGQNVGDGYRQNVGLTYNHEQRNYKKEFKNFGSYSPQTLVNRAIPTVEKTREMLEKYREEASNTLSPLDYNKDDALSWLKNVPKMLRNSFFATSLLKKYDFDPQEVWGT